MTQTRLVIDLDEELKTNLQIIAVKQRKTMKQVVTELITEFVEQNM